MTDKPSLNLKTGGTTWNSVTMGGLKDYKPDYNARLILRGAGGSDWVDMTAVTEQHYLVAIGYDDQATLAALHAKKGEESTLVVQSLDMNGGGTGYQDSFANARMVGANANHGYGILGAFVAVFAVRSTDGAADPLTVSTF